MSNQPRAINSPIGPISVAYSLNISHDEINKLTQGEKIQLLRMIHSGFLNPSNSNEFEDTNMNNFTL